MLISQLIASDDLKSEIKNKDVTLITDDSRKCRKGSIFVCHKSGEEFVNDALERGADLVIAEKKLCEDCFVTDDTRKTYAMLCAAYFSNCHKRLRLIAVTGTNGKTTTASMIFTILTLSGKKCGLIGTVSNNICGEESPSPRTTPDCFEFHRMLSELYNWGAEYCVIEASSQGIAQQRLFGLELEVTVLTNISRDHLDYHGTMENYVSAKKELFACSRKAIINYDEPYKDEFIACCKGKVITYSALSNEASFVAKCVTKREDGSDYAVVADYLIHRIKLFVPGDFNISNSLAAIAVCFDAGISLEGCAHALRSFSGVRGRMEILSTALPFKVIIDYAHTPDSLKKVLLTLRNFPHSRIITLFGCGGERDKTKRPLMGDIASQLSDIVIITSDNPRSEDPQDIIDDILSGVTAQKKSIFIFPDRVKAIEYALKIGEKNDIILLAGKGHETTQETGEKEIPMDEREIVAGFQYR